MLERFQTQLAESGLIPENSRVLVGYSGGADSTCLLHLLHLSGVDVVAAHLHHGQREEADRELKLCEAFAESLGVPFASGRANVPAISNEMGVGLEEAGREARYNFFRQAAYRLECDLIATAHTRNDQIETVFLNITRGSGLAGLAGIPVRREQIVRPLLAFSREETRGYCEANGFWFHDDPANSDVSFSRARVRHRVLPELRLINPAVDESIARLAHIASEEDRFLNGMAAAALEQSEIPLNGDLRFLTLDAEVAFKLPVLAHLPPVLFRRALRLATESLGGGLTYDQTLSIEASVREGGRGSMTAEGGLVAAEWDIERLHVRLVQPTETFRFPLTMPGETESEEFGWRFEAFVEPVSLVAPVRASLSAELASSGLKGSLYFRTAEPGDQMMPLGFDHRRKLADILSEAKLTPAARRRLPIVCDLVGPVWAPGVCLDERVRPGEGPVVKISLIGLEG
ncbi:tRNA lysidine(34) synthetase TilS [soil metagenome]